jgi:hypothetical protein
MNFSIASGVVMALGWGLRGHIGGGPFGAMIPGVFLALFLSLRQTRPSGLWMALLAVGFGFGGEETYGQTVGLGLDPHTRAWALLGFFLKGAAWGLLAAGSAALAFVQPRAQVTAALALMILLTDLGWRFVNHPKLIYFSNRLDRPREELWFGLILGGLALLAAQRSALAWRWGAIGFLSGGIGFALGAWIQVLGRTLSGHPKFDWWKVMEFVFGFCLGVAFARFSPPDGNAAPPSRPWNWLIGCAIAAATLALYPALPVRYGFTVLGSVLILIALWNEALAWQVAITLTYAAFAFDRLEHDWNHAWWWWVIPSTALTAWITDRWLRHDARLALWFLMGAGVLHALIKGSSLFVESAFVAMAIAAALYTRRNEFVSKSRVIQDRG